MCQSCDVSVMWCTSHVMSVMWCVSHVMHQSCDVSMWCVSHAIHLLYHRLLNWSLDFQIASCDSVWDSPAHHSHRQPIELSRVYSVHQSSDKTKNKHDCMHIIIIMHTTPLQRATNLQGSPLLHSALLPTPLLGYTDTHTLTRVPTPSQVRGGSTAWRHGESPLPRRLWPTQ